MALALTLTLVLALVRNIIIFSKIRVLVLNQPITTTTTTTKNISFYIDFYLIFNGFLVLKLPPNNPQKTPQMIFTSSGVRLVRWPLPLGRWPHSGDSVSCVFWSPGKID